MQFQEKILNTKLLIPLQSQIFIRPGLLAGLTRMAEKRLTLVTAGAGYGKTTLIAQAVEQQGIRSVWYSLDEQDEEFLTFVKYTIAGFEPYSGDGKNITGNFPPGFRLTRAGRLEILKRLVHPLASSTREEILFVLDDFHLIQHSPDIRESVEFLLKHLPGFVHMVIITRAEPRVSLSKLRLTDQVMEIRESDLTLTPLETKAFYSRQFNLCLTHDNAVRLHQKTGGWIASLILFRLALKGKSHNDMETELNGFTGSGRHIFDYLEENIFRSQPAEIQGFMMKTALLETLVPDFCNAYLDINDSRQILDQLVDSHLLTSKNDPGSMLPSFYCYHQLLKDFLRAKLKRSTPPETVRNLYLKIARLLEENGNDIPAIRYYLGGKHFSIAAQRLIQCEKALFQAGEVRQVHTLLNGFPKDVIQSTPELLYINAKVCSFSGTPLEAVPLFEDALKGFKKTESNPHILDCRIQLGLNHYYTGHIREAEHQLKNCMGTGCDIKNLEVIGLMILISAILGKINRADAYAETARQKLKGLTGVTGEGMKTWIEFTYSHRFFVSGDFRTAYAMALKTLDKYKKMNADIIMPLAYLHAALPAYFLGQFSKGYKWAQKGMAYLKKMGIRDNQPGWLSYAMALHLTGLNRLDDALACARQSLCIFERHANYWGQAGTYDLIHFIFLKKGRREDAENALSQGMDVLKDRGLPHTEGILEIGRLRILLEKRQPGIVSKQLAPVKQKVAISKFYTLKSLLISSKCHLYQKKEQTALKELKQALDIAEAWGYEQQFYNESRWMDPLLKKLYAEDGGENRIQKIPCLRDRLFLPPPPKKAARTTADLFPDIRRKPVPPVPALKVSLLGRFKIRIGKEECRFETFRNSNALMMIKYLALKHPGGYIHRDELIELLWPEQNFNKTRKRFNVVVSAIRKFFDPDIRRTASSRYLKKQGVSFLLDPGKDGRIDVHAFLDEIVKGDRAGNPRQAAHHYARAQAMYSGPFLIEDTYTQWCCEEREKLQDQYLSILWKLICYFFDKRKYVKGLFYTEKYLAVDNSVERVYRKLMQFHAMAGNLSEIKKIYKKCEQNVARALDCTLDPKTTDLYRSFFPDA